MLIIETLRENKGTSENVMHHHILNMTGHLIITENITCIWKHFAQLLKVKYLALNISVAITWNNP